MAKRQPGRWKPFVAGFGTAIVLIAAAGVGLVLTIAWRGVSAKAEPSAAEAFLARRLRHLAIPADAREVGNPLPARPDVVRAGMEHFADHCATCHANDGSGQTAIGQGLYPKAPDMRLEATQSLSDGELFYIIENGVRLTGMPAWGSGDPAGARDSWGLVAFIRHLPNLTPEDLAAMETLNPKSAAEREREKAIEEFLKTERTMAPAGTAGRH